MGIWPSAQLLPLFRGDEMTVYEDCLYVCADRDASYFGIDSGTMCWCADENVKARAQDPSLCRPCQDDSQHTCGDVNYGFASIYRIQVV